MAEFVCKVADASGRVYSQVEPAQSISEARQKLSDRGLFVYQVRPRDVMGGALGQRREIHARAQGTRDLPPESPQRTATRVVSRARSVSARPPARLGRS